MADSLFGGSQGTPLAGGNIPIVIPFAAGDFLGNGAMVFTVTSGQVSTFTYNVNGKLCTVWFSITGGVISGTVSNQSLRLLLPQGMLAARLSMQPVYVNNGGTAHIGIGYVLVDTGYIYIQKDPLAGVWVAGATNLNGTITFEIK